MSAPVPFVVRYVTPEALGEFPAADSHSIIGVIAYGADRPTFLPEACPFAAANLPVAGGGATFEVWSAPSEARYRRVGPIVAGYTEELAFGLIELNEGAGRSLATLVENAYRGIFDFLEEIEYRSPIRFWNYLPEITADEKGLERYRHFNIGRHDAFSAKLRQPLPPVASAVGGRGGSPLIYFLAARQSARTIENPRQISAYAYPPIYGPRSPGFSRASLHGTGAAHALLISGTASIVGHESRHVGNAAAQTVETLENVRTLLREAKDAGFPVSAGSCALKIYLRDPADFDVVRANVDAMFGQDCERIYLRADMCRVELLVEIEAVCLVGDGLGRSRSLKRLSTREA
jgi:chorismate lyase / 3-hydroxybenzoate synthase